MLWHSGRWVLLALVCSFTISSSAQKTEAPNPHEQNDNSAEAYVIEETIESFSFENDGSAAREHRSKIRIQSDAGVQRYGVLSFSYQKAFDTLDINYVRVRKGDGTVITTPLDDVQDMPSAIAREAPFYSDLREKHVPVKGLGTGAVLEYQCHWRQKPLVPGQFFLGYFFNRDEIVLRQELQVSIPRDRAVKMSTPELVPATADSGGRRTYTWSRRNPALQKIMQLDVAQLAIRGQLPAPDVQLSTFESWNEVARWYNQLQQERVAPTAELRQKAAEITRNAADEDAKIRAIYRYVSTEYRYIGVALGIGRYQPHFASEVLSNGYGDCKDKHTLLAALLSAAGIGAYPALINASRTLDEAVPSPGQFDHIITVVPRGKENLWLDTTLEVGPLGYLAPTLRNKPALAVLPGTLSGLQKTPEDPPFRDSWVFKIDAKLDDAGTLEGKVDETLRGDLEVKFRAGLRSLPRSKWKDLVQAVSYALGFGGDVSDVNASSPESTDEPLKVSYTYKRKDYPDWKERRVVLPAPNVIALPGEEDGKRPKSMWLGARGEFQFESKVELPQGYIPEVPASSNLIRDYLEYHSVYALDNGALVGRYRVELKRPLIVGDEVSDYEAVAKQIHEDRDQYISLSTGGPQTPKQAMMGFMAKIRELPDTKDAAALQAERDAQAAIQQGSSQGAIESMKRAVAKDTKFTRGWIMLGTLQIGMSDNDGGVASLRRAVESDPQNPLCYKVLAFSLTSIKRRRDAIQTWHELEKVSPSDRDIPTNLGSLLISEREYRSARLYLERAANLYPDDARPLLGLGRVYLDIGDDAQALAFYERAVKLEPAMKNDVAYELAVSGKLLNEALGYARQAVQEEEEASRSVQLSKLAEEDLGHTQRLAAYWDTLGWVHFRKGNFKQAHNYLLAAWDVMQTPTTGYHLGQVYEKLQRPADAAHVYRLASSSSPRGAEDEDAVKDCNFRLKQLKVPLPPKPNVLGKDFGAAEEMSRNRTIVLPKLVKQHANAEFFVLFGPGPKVEDTKFISGSEELQSASKALQVARFTNVAFPEGSSGRLVRRGILACYPITGCSFVLLSPENVRSVN